MGTALDQRGQAPIMPGFDDSSTYVASLHRAIREGVRLTPTDRLDTFIAWRSGSLGRYVTTSMSCTCPAGQHGRLCKHRSLVMFIATVIVDPRSRGP